MSSTKSLRQPVVLPKAVGIHLPGFSRLGIRQKIGIGYALVAGIAILGATAGFVIEGYYQRQRQTELASQVRKVQLLNQITQTVTDLQADQTQLPTVLGEKPQREGTISSIRADLGFELNGQLADFQSLSRRQNSRQRKRKPWKFWSSSITRPEKTTPLKLSHYYRRQKPVTPIPGPSKWLNRI
ncbi:MAG: hypothetical protein ACFBSC_17255 [Microcoleaceae cyanobacterium]